jgi:head-tail adaptor
VAFPKGAGALSERVGFYRFQKVKDLMGGYMETEMLIGAAYAQVNVTQARDNIIADQMRDLRTHEIIVRAGAVKVQQGDIAVWRGERLKVRTTKQIANWNVYDCITDVR